MYLSREKKKKSHTQKKLYPHTQKKRDIYSTSHEDSDRVDIDAHFGWWWWWW